MKFKDEIKIIFKKFERPPFLFIGAGMSRRYLDTPDWRSLLIMLISIYDENSEYKFNSYQNSATNEFKCKPEDTYKTYPLIATHIENDFNNKYFQDRAFAAKIDTCTSTKPCFSLENPFRIYLAYFFEASTKHISQSKELLQFKRLTSRIMGVITTNFDTLLEDMIFRDFTVYISQSELMKKPSYSIDEIYKMHGCCRTPDSVVITSADYQNFNRKCYYLTSKLTTLFIENPIVFMGYSLNDADIKLIFSNIYNSLDSDVDRNFTNRIIFVNYILTTKDQRITNKNIEGLDVTQIDLCDYSFFYKCFEDIRPKVRASFVRKYVKELYDFSVGHNTSIYVKDIDNPSVKDCDLALAIGEKVTISKFGQEGVSGLKVKNLFEDILLDSPKYINVDLFPMIDSIPSTTYLPIHMYPSLNEKEIKSVRKYVHIISRDLSELTREANGEINSQYSTANNYLRSKTFLSINDIKKNAPEASVLKIILLFIDEDKLEELLIFLRDYMKTNENWYNNTDYKKLICAYDFLKYRKRS